VYGSRFDLLPYPFRGTTTHLEEILLAHTIRLIQNLRIQHDKLGNSHRRFDVVWSSYRNSSQRMISRVLHIIKDFTSH